MRRLAQCAGAFASYLRSAERLGQSDPRDVLESKPQKRGKSALFPLPLPSAKAVGGSAEPRLPPNGRARSRALKRRAVRQLQTAMVHFLNFEASGRRRGATRTERPNASEAQKRALACLEDAARAMLCAEVQRCSIATLALGRGKIAAGRDAVAMIRRRVSEIALQDGSYRISAAVAQLHSVPGIDKGADVDMSRVKLPPPGLAATVPVAEFLSGAPELLAAYEHPSTLERHSGDALGLGTAGYAAPSPYRTAAGLGPAGFAAPSPNNDAAGPGTAGNAAPSPDRTAAGLGPAGFAAPSPNIGAAGFGTAGDAAPSPDRTAAELGLAGYAAPSPNVGPASCVTDSAGAAGTALETVLQRYAAVHLRTKPSKVQDYNAVQDLVGHTLDHNVLRASCSRYAAIRAEVLRLLRSRWCRPRDIERIVGKLTHIMLLHRQSLALFNAVYAFCRTNWPERPRRLWLSVQQELSDAIALLPLIRSDLSRPVATALLQTDACDTGAAVVYTDKVDHKALRQECARPRRALQEPSEPITPWTAATGLGAAFEASVDPADWHVAVRCTYPVASRARLAHINEKEAGALVLAVRWAARSRRTRRCRIVIQSDSAAAVCAMRKGRSSKRGMRLQCRRLAALTLAHAITAEFRWVATDRNMADRPSRGSARPGPCVEEGAGHDWQRGKRLGEAENPGPGQLQPFWTPLLDGNVKAQTLTRYDAEARHFIEFVRERGDRIHTKEDLDYWMSYYCHIAYTDGYRSKSACEKALAGLEHWLPEFKPLPLTRRCLRGWGRLQPPQPAAPFPRDLVWACATLACLSGDVAAGVAMLVAYDCWLRIGEVSGVTVADVYDSRRQVDPVGRGVSVFLPETKTGRRQAVMVEEPAVAALLLALARAQDQRTAKLFPTPDTLRRVLARCLGALNVEAHGLAFVWHGFRHGGASRAFLRGDEISSILVRGRWAAESSGRHYIQSGRQLLIAQQLPGEVTDLARRIERVGLESLLARDLRARLR